MGFSAGSVLFSVLGSQARILGSVILHGSDPVAITTVVLVLAAVAQTVGMLF
jgi:hypothetical protein